MKSAPGIFLAVVVCVLAAHPAWALFSDNQQLLTASGGEADDQFGDSVNIFENYAIVGAPYASGSGSSSGAAYVYYRQGGSWNQQAKLTAGVASITFGTAVCLTWDRAIVSAPATDSPGQGAAYVFAWDGDSWEKQAELKASDGAAYDYFGAAAAIAGDYAVVGASYSNYGSGAAYIYHWDGTSWIEQQKVAASSGSPGDIFGSSVSIDGNRVLVGAPGKNSVYVFDRDGASWEERQILTGNESAPGDSFGSSVSLSADRLLVGSDADDFSKGSAYVFANSGAWSQEQKLTDSGGDKNDMFGWSVGLSGDYGIIGAYGKNSVRGTAFIYHWSSPSWGAQEELSLAGLEENDYYGYSVSLSGSAAIVGIPGYGSNNAGAARLYMTEILPSLRTASPTNIRSTSADVSGDRTYAGGSTITDQGFCYGTSPAPDKCVSANNLTASFNATLTNLTPRTTYYVRAYASTSGGDTSYAGGRRFTTSSGGNTPVVSVFGALVWRLVLALALCLAAWGGVRGRRMQ